MEATTNGNGKPHVNAAETARREAIVWNALETRTMIARGLYSQMFDPRRNINHECGYPETGEVTVEKLQQLYEREPVAARVVEIMPRESWKVQPYIYEEEDADTITPFEESWDELGKSLRGVGWHKQEEGSIVFEYLQRLDEQCGIGAYGILLLGFDDGLDLTQPVKGVEEANSAPASKENPSPQANGVYRLTMNAKAKAGRKLLYVRVFPQALAQVSQWESNPTSLRYGQPVQYSLTFNDPNNSMSISNPVGTMKNVHWTRVIHVADNLASSETLGVPRMLPVLNPLLDIQKIRAADGEGYWKNAFAQLYLEMLPEFAELKGSADVEGLRTMMESMQNGLQRWGVLEGLSAKAVPPTIVDPTPHFDTQIRTICIKLAVPVRVFEGSERGELASSQDADSWESRIRGRRNGFITPRIIAPFVDRLIMTGVLAEPAEEGYCIEWPEAETVTPMEKAQIAHVITQAITTYVSGGGEQLMTPMDYLTRVLHFSEEEAEVMLEDTEEKMLEDEQADIEKQQQMIDEGLAPDPTDPKQQMPMKVKPGEQVVMPNGKPPKEDDEEITGNVYCKTGEGGGIDPSCSGGGGGGGEGSFAKHGQTADEISAMNPSQRKVLAGMLGMKVKGLDDDTIKKALTPSKPKEAIAKAASALSSTEHKAALSDLLAAVAKGEEAGSADPRGDLKHLPKGEKLSAVMDALKESVSASTSVDALYEQVNKAAPITPEEFRATLLHASAAKAVKLSGWPRMLDDLPRPDLAPVASSMVIGYVHPAQGR